MSNRGCLPHSLTACSPIVFYVFLLATMQVITPQHVELPSIEYLCCAGHLTEVRVITTILQTLKLINQFQSL